MKTCTKLHFTDKNNPSNKIEDFFLGGYLQYDGTNVIYTQDGKEYTLDAADFVFMSPTNTIINDENYRKILPIYNTDSLKQNLECRCSIVRGELPYDVRHGIPLKASLAQTQISILNIINTTPGVQSCRVVSSKLVDKKFRLEVTIQSNFGNFTMLAG